MPLKDVPFYEPREIAVGETLEWKRALAEFPAGTYTLTYYVRGAGPGFNVAAAQEGSIHHVTVPSSTTQNLVAGTYTWEAWTDDGAGGQYLVASGEFKVITSLKAMTTSTTLDNRSQAKKILDAIDAMMIGKATLDQQSYTIGNRQLSRIPIPELLKARTHYAKLYARERRAERLKTGAPYLKTVLVRFDRPE